MQLTSREGSREDCRASLLLHRGRILQNAAQASHTVVIHDLDRRATLGVRRSSRGCVLWASVGQSSENFQVAQDASDGR